MLPRPQVTGNGVLLSPDGAPASDAFVGLATIPLEVVDTTGYASVSWSILYKVAGSDAALSASSGFAVDLTKTAAAADAIDIRVEAIGTDGRRSVHIVRVVVPTAEGNLLLDRTDASVEEVTRAKVNAGIIRPGSGGGGSGNATSLQSRALASTAPLADQFVGSADGATWLPLYITQDMIRPGASTTLAKTGGTALLEIGATLATPAFTSSPSATPSSAIVTDSDGNPAQDVTSTPTGWSSAYSYTKSTNAQTVVWTVTDVIGGVTKTASVTQQWGTRLYYGASSEAATFDATFIAGLATSVLGTARARSIGYTLATGQRFVIALPQSFGTPTFTVGGFLIAPDVLATGVSVTNPQGVAVLCDVYAVSNFATGASSATVVVS